MNTISDREVQQPVFRPMQGEPPPPDFVRYLRTLNRYKWGILLVVIAVGMLASLYANSLRPVYRASATLLIEQSKPKVVTNQELYEAYTGTTRDYFLTQFEIMKSRDLAQRVVRLLQLTKHPEYDPRLRTMAWYWAWVPERFQPAPSGQAPSEKDLEESVVASVMGQLSLQPLRNTQLVKVNFDSHDPVLAERVPNTLAMIYILADQESRGEQTQRSMSFLNTQSEELKRKLDESERALQAFREQEKIVVSKGVSLAGPIRQLEELAVSLEDARKKRADLEAVYNQLSVARQNPSKGALELPSEVQKNLVIMRFKEAEAEAERRVSEASKRYGPEHPRMLAAQSDLKAAQENVRRQVATVIETIAKDYELAKANETALENALARAKADSQTYNRKEFTLARLEREAAANRQLYDLFTQRSKETRSGDLQSPIARLIDAAIVPKAPFGPNKRNIVGTAMLIALLITMSIALLLEQLDITVKSSAEVESKLEVKAVGVLPRMRLRGKVPLERLFIEQNQSPFAEAIRSIRSDVMLSGIDSPQKVVLLTSSLPEEGKTTVACNLAFAFSQVKKTLLVEADMRRPKIARVLGMAKCGSTSASFRRITRTCGCCRRGGYRSILSSCSPRTGSAK
jgi:polysaccharide biosynthesis transport protein